MLNISWDNILNKDKTLAKPNAVIDGRTRNYSLLSKNFMNVLLYINEKEKSSTFDIPLVKLRDYLGLTNNKDFKSRIEKSMLQLKNPIELRDFTYKGKDVKYMPVSFLGEETFIYKEGNKNHARISISEAFVEAVKQKCGFTLLEFMKLQECSTIFGHEIAQMLFRYKNLPNHKHNDIGRITRTIEQLNNMFDTNYTYKSEMQRKLDKAYKDIQENLKLEYHYMWDDLEDYFIFSWEKQIQVQESCKFPKARLREFAEWIYDHYKKPVEDKGKFITSTIKKLKAGEWENAEKIYRGMLQRKYNILDPDMFYDEETKKYIDFKEKK